MSNFRRSGSFAISPKKQTFSPGTFVTPSNRRQSLNTSTNSVLFDATNNDEAEKWERKLNRLQQLQSRGVHSPTGTPNDRRKSTSAFAGFTHQQITEHYSKCIQLSAENKINIKNAFNLQLIDYMAENMKRKDSEMNNFQVASCTLDASTKIYGYRVDSVHSDTLKMAGGLGRTKDRPDDENNEAVDEDHPKGKKKVKPKKSVLVEKNLKNINVTRFDLEFDVDPLFKKTATQFDEGRIGGGQFLNTLQFVDDRAQLIQDSETVLIPNETEPEENQVITEVMPHLSDLSKHICSTFVSFEFTTWNLSDEESLRDDINANNEADPGLAFDINAVPEPLDNYQFEGDDFNDIPCNEDVEDDDNRTVVTIGGGDACQQSHLPPQLEIIHLKDHLANNPLEYSYFDTRMMSAWAGPGHWKLRSLMKEKDTTKQGNRMKKKNNDMVVEYSVSLDIEKDFSKSKKSTIVMQSTIKKWNNNNTTLPVDLHFDSSNFFKLFERPGVVIRKQEIKSEIEEIKLEEDVINTSNKVEDYGDDDGSNYGDHTAAGYDETDLFSQTVLPSQPEKNEQKDFLGDNLVEAPNKVAQINIGYARTAKKIDMKKLKTSMWTLLSDPENNKENERNKVNEQMDSKRRENFSVLYADLHPRLPQKMSENLSVPLAFIALLHLANEHNLKLTSLEELGDFSISQG